MLRTLFIAAIVLYGLTSCNAVLDAAVPSIGFRNTTTEVQLKGSNFKPPLWCTAHFNGSSSHQQSQLGRVLSETEAQCSIMGIGDAATVIVSWMAVGSTIEKHQFYMDFIPKPYIAAMSAHTLQPCSESLVALKLTNVDGLQAVLAQGLEVVAEIELTAQQDASQSYLLPADVVSADNLTFTIPHDMLPGVYIVNASLDIGQSDVLLPTNDTVDMTLTVQQPHVLFDAAAIALPLATSRLLTLPVRLTSPSSSAVAVQLAFDSFNVTALSSAFQNTAGSSAGDEWLCSLQLLQPSVQWAPCSSSLQKMVSLQLQCNVSSAAQTTLQLADGSATSLQNSRHDLNISPTSLRFSYSNSTMQLPAVLKIASVQGRASADSAQQLMAVVWGEQEPHMAPSFAVDTYMVLYRNSTAATPFVPPVQGAISKGVQPNRSADGQNVVKVWFNRTRSSSNLVGLPSIFSYKLTSAVGTIPDGVLVPMSGQVEWLPDDADYKFVAVAVNWQHIAYTDALHVSVQLQPVWHAEVVNTTQVQMHVFGTPEGSCPPGTHDNGALPHTPTPFASSNGTNTVVNDASAVILVETFGPGSRTSLIGNIYLSAQNATRPVNIQLSPQFSMDDDEYVAHVEFNLTQFSLVLMSYAPPPALYVSGCGVNGTWVLHAPPAWLVQQGMNDRQLQSCLAHQNWQQVVSANNAWQMQLPLQPANASVLVGPLCNVTVMVYTPSGSLYTQLLQNHTASTCKYQPPSWPAQTVDHANASLQTTLLKQVQAVALNSTFALQLVQLTQPSHAQLDALVFTLQRQVLGKENVIMCGSDSYLERHTDFSLLGNVTECKPDVPLYLDISNEPAVARIAVNAVKCFSGAQVTLHNSLVSDEDLTNYISGDAGVNASQVQIIPFLSVPSDINTTAYPFFITVQAEDGVTSRTYTVVLGPHLTNDTEANQQWDPLRLNHVNVSVALPATGTKQLSASQVAQDHNAQDEAEQQHPDWPVAPKDQEYCSACLPGYYSQAVDVSVCTRCMPGSYAAEAGSTACASCPPGYFTRSWGSRTCQPCMIGAYTNQTGSQWCTLCSSGWTTFEDGSDNCTLPVDRAADLSNVYAIIVSFGVILNGTSLDEVSSSTGVNASGHSIVELLVKYDTASRFNISLSDVQVTTITQVGRRMLELNVTANVPVDVPPDASAAEIAAALQVGALSADNSLNNMVDDPDGFFGRTTKALNAHASVTIPEHRESQPFVTERRSLWMWIVFPTCVGLVALMTTVFCAHRIQRCSRTAPWTSALQWRSGGSGVHSLRSHSHSSDGGAAAHVIAPEAVIIVDGSVMEILDSSALQRRICSIAQQSSSCTSPSLCRTVPAAL